MYNEGGLYLAEEGGLPQGTKSELGPQPIAYLKITTKWQIPFSGESNLTK